MAPKRHLIDFVAHKLPLAGRDRDLQSHHAERGRFTGAVRAQEAVDFTVFHAESVLADCHCLRPTVSLANVGCADLEAIRVVLRPDSSRLDHVFVLRDVIVNLQQGWQLSSLASLLLVEGPKAHVDEDDKYEDDEDLGNEHHHRKLNIGDAPSRNREGFNLFIFSVSFFATLGVVFVIILKRFSNHNTLVTDVLGD